MSKQLIGVYRESDMPLAGLHPAAKMLVTLSFAISAGMVQDFIFMTALALLCFAVGAVSGIMPRDLLSALRSFRFLLIFTFIVQIFLSPAGSWAAPDLYALIHAAFLALKMAVIIGFSSVFAMITPPIDIVRIFYMLFSPLKIFKISPADMALSMLVALRFIPLLFDEGEKILDSRRLKGLLPPRGGKVRLKESISSAVALIIPLFVRTFHYSDQISITLLYRRKDADFFRLSGFSAFDIAMVVAAVVISVGVAVVSKIS